jgi:hypothetical protein
MTKLLCPDCGSPLDLFDGIVARPRTWVVSLDRDAAVPLHIDEVQRRAQMVTCSGCEYAATVTAFLKGMR